MMESDDLQQEIHQLRELVQTSPSQATRVPVSTGLFIEMVNAAVFARQQWKAEQNLLAITQTWRDSQDPAFRMAAGIIESHIQPPQQEGH